MVSGYGYGLVFADLEVGVANGEEEVTVYYGGQDVALESHAQAFGGEIDALLSVHPEKVGCVP